MIHRRLLKDDGRGVGEPLNELDKDGEGLRQLVRHYVVFGDQFRQVQKWIDQRIQPIFSPSSSNTFSSKSIRPAPISVPDAVKLYLRPFTDGSYLLRLHNTNTLNKVSVSLGNEWKAVEQTLAANQLAEDWKKKQYSWNEQSKLNQMPENQRLLLKTFAELTEDIKSKWNNLINSEDSVTTIDLLPFQMKAFKITRA